MSILSHIERLKEEVSTMGTRRITYLQPKRASANVSVDQAAIIDLLRSQMQNLEKCKNEYEQTIQQLREQCETQETEYHDLNIYVENYAKHVMFFYKFGLDIIGVGVGMVLTSIGDFFIGDLFPNKWYVFSIGGGLSFLLAYVVDIIVGKISSQSLNYKDHDTVIRFIRKRVNRYIRHITEKR